MEKPDIEELRKSWMDQDASSTASLSEEDIRGFLQGSSRDITRQFRLGLDFDIVLKSILILSFVGSIFLFRNNMEVIALSGSLILVLGLGIRFQARMKQKVPGSPHGISAREALERKISFYHTFYFRSISLGALSSTLLFLSGMLYYFYFRYGMIRPFTWDDYLVFGLFLFLSYLLSFLANHLNFRARIGQLEESLEELDREALDELKLKDLKRKKLRRIIAFSLTVLAGLLLLFYLLAS